MVQEASPSRQISLLSLSTRPSTFSSMEASEGTAALYSIFYIYFYFFFYSSFVYLTVSLTSFMSSFRLFFSISTNLSIRSPSKSSYGLGFFPSYKICTLIILSIPVNSIGSNWPTQLKNSVKSLAFLVAVFLNCIISLLFFRLFLFKSFLSIFLITFLTLTLKSVAGSTISRKVSSIFK